MNQTGNSCESASSRQVPAQEVAAWFGG